MLRLRATRPNRTPFWKVSESTVSWLSFAARIDRQSLTTTLGMLRRDYYVEFLTPIWRRRQREDTVRIGGVIAQALPRLDVVMVEPWSIVVPGADGDFRVRVANPVSYIAQKLMVMGDRPAQDRAKDILYIHDTLELYGGRLEELHRLWRESIRPEIGKHAHVVVSCARSYFDEVTDDIRRGALVASGRDLEAETLRIRCQVALERIFDGSRN